MRRGGFTLVELMIAVGILAVIMAWLLGTFTTQHRTYVVVDEVSQAQGNARAVADLIERDLRSAGFKTPEQAAACGVDSTVGPDSLYVSATDVLSNVGPGLTMSLVGVDWGGDIQAVTAGNITLNGATGDDIDGDGASEFVGVGGVIVLNVDDNTGPVACGNLTGAPVVGGSTVSLAWTLQAGALPPGLGNLKAIPAHRYSIVGGQLLRDGTVLIESAEDLQLAYFFDTNSNNIVDANETHGDGAGATANYNPAAANGFDLREVRLNLIVTTANPDPNARYTEGMGQATENRTVASLIGPDSFRRRLHTASVRVRNVGTR